MPKLSKNDPGLPARKVSCVLPELSQQMFGARTFFHFIAITQRNRIPADVRETSEIQVVLHW